MFLSKHAILLYLFLFHDIITILAGYWIVDSTCYLLMLGFGVIPEVTKNLLQTTDKS